MPEPSQLRGRSGIVTTRGVTHIAVQCDSCGWFRDTGNYEADRMAGRRHAEDHAHLVQMYAERRTTWDGTPAVVAAAAERAAR